MLIAVCSAGASAPSEDTALVERLLQARSDAARESLLDEAQAQLDEPLAQALVERSKAAQASGELLAAGNAAAAALLVARRLHLPAREGAALSRLGMLAEARGDLVRSLRLLEQAEALARANADPKRLMSALNNEAILNRRLGDYDRALALYRDALALAESLAEPGASAVPLNNIGVLLYNRGDLRGALEHYERALRLLPAGDDLLADTLLNIGLLHQSQGDLELAESYLRRSLATSLELHALDDLHDTYLRLGDLLWARGRRAEALQALAQAEERAKRMDDPLTLSEIGALRGQMALETGQTDEALEAYRVSLERATAAGARENRGLALAGQARALLAAGRAPEARAAAEEAVQLLAEMHNLERLWPAQAALSHALRALARLDDARAAYESSIATIEELRETLAGDESQRQAFLEGKLEPYQALVELLMSEGLATAALEASERARGRTLTDVLLRGRLRLDHHLSAEEHAEESRLEQGLAELHARLATGGDEQQRASQQRQLAELRQRLRDFRARAFANHPELRLAKGDLPPAGVELAGQLLDASSALLAYCVLRERTYAFVLTRADARAAVRLETFELRLGSAELGRQVSALRQALAARDLDYAAAARPLAEQLLGPARRALVGRSRLYVVPDGPLWELPFEVLPDPHGGALIDALALSYAPSLTALGALRRPPQAPAAGARSLLALGNPRLEDAQAAPALLEAERQVRALGRLYGGDARVLVGARAGEAAFKAEAGLARVLHVATHGRLDDASPLFSSLFLARDAPAEDGRLEARELLQMDLQADVVVLSACETGRGRLGSGEGLIGLSWAVALAGTPNVVASHWRVDSQSTTELMLAFHRRLRRAPAGARLDLARALRDAAVELRRDPRYRHPFHWAGFFVLGTGQS